MQHGSGAVPSGARSSRTACVATSREPVVPRGLRFAVALASVALISALAVACSPEYPACNDDAGCQQDGRTEYCVDRQCRQCRDDSHCIAALDPGHVCEGGVCVKIDGYCDPPAHPCPDAMVCRENVCGPECTGDEHCPPGTICTDAHCETPCACVSDADCPEDTICRDCECIPAANRTDE